jgi:hypothetical protein
VQGSRLDCVAVRYRRPRERAPRPGVASGTERSNLAARRRSGIRSRQDAVPAPIERRRPRRRDRTGCTQTSAGCTQTSAPARCSSRRILGVSRSFRDKGLGTHVALRVWRPPEGRARGRRHHDRSEPWRWRRRPMRRERDRDPAVTGVSSVVRRRGAGRVGHQPAVGSWEDDGSGCSPSDPGGWCPASMGSDATGSTTALPGGPSLLDGPGGSGGAVQRRTQRARA